MRIPIFPLGTLLVPGLVMPLHIFEPRYLGLIEELLLRPDPDAREFGLSTLRPGSSIEAGGSAALFPVGTLALVKEVEHRPDGRLDIVTVGTRRYRHVEVDASAPLVHAEVEILEDELGDLDPGEARRTTEAFRRYRTTLGDVLGIQVNAAHEANGALTTDPFDDALPDDPALLGHLITAAVILPLHERSSLLAATDVSTRLTMARSLLQRECAVIPRLPSLPAVDFSGAGIESN